MFGNRRKEERAEAIVLLSQMPQDAIDLLVSVVGTFASGRVEDANRLVLSCPTSVGHVLEFLNRPRSRSLTAGSTGDRLNLSVWTQSLLDQGYSADTAAIVAAVHHHNLDEVLKEIVAKPAVRPVADSAVALPASGHALPEALTERAMEAPTMVRVLVDIFDARLRRERPQVLAESGWSEFRSVATIGGCVVLAFLLHSEATQESRTLLEGCMRSSLALGLPDADEMFQNCVGLVREALLEVDRPRRHAAVFVLVSMWALGVVAEGDSLNKDPQLVAELASLYQSELPGYWSRAIP